MYASHIFAQLVDRYATLYGRADKNESRVRKVLKLSYICRILCAFFRSDCGRIFGNSMFYEIMFVDNRYRMEPRDTFKKRNLILLCHISFSHDNKYRNATVLKDETDIFANITASLIGQAVILVNVYVETFKIDVIIFIGKVTMYFTPHR